MDLKGNVIDSWSSPHDEPSGLAWDGKHLWSSDNTECEAYKHDPSTGEVLDSFSLPGGKSEGLAWIGAFLWSADEDKSEIYKHDPGTGNVLETITTKYRPEGLANYHGEIIYCNETDVERVQKFTWR